MLTTILIATFFSFGFFIESIVGFGGGLIAYSLLGFFIDIKTMVIAGLYIGTCSSSYIFYTDYKSFNKKVFLKALPFCFVGTTIGVLIFSNFTSTTLSLILGILLVFLSARIIFFEKLSLSKIFKNKLLLIGGISQGAFGIGGPFIVNALQKDFKNKSELRTTMSMFFVSFNIVRIIQLSIQGQINLAFIGQIYWAIIPILIAIYFGFKIHLKINEKILKKMIALITLLGGTKLLIQFFNN
jgi:uncharacterized protein